MIIEMIPPRELATVDPTACGLLTIDLAAVEANWRHLSALANGVPCAGVVKADDYGVGAVAVTRRLLGAGCRTFFVAQFDEALELKHLLPPDASIAVLNGLLPGAEPDYADAGIIPVANSLAQFGAWSAFARARGQRLPVYLQIDTGMARLGLSEPELQELARSPELFGTVALDLVMSHLAVGDEPDNPANTAQLEEFHRARRLVPPAPASLANSAGIFLGSAYHFDLCRPGAAVYGIHVGPRTEGIRPVATLSGRVAQIRTVPAGTPVGYSHTFTAATEMRLATIAVGYADGFPRSLGNAGSAWFEGVRLPIVGRVSMDSTILDVTALRDGQLRPGDFVELIGPNQSADDLGRDAGTFGYEVLTRLGHRYPRQYV
jgi:alanine racemase